MSIGNVCCSPRNRLTPRKAATTIPFDWGCSSAGERLNGIQEVVGSIPISSTQIWPENKRVLSGLGFWEAGRALNSARNPNTRKKDPASGNRRGPSSKPLGLPRAPTGGIARASATSVVSCRCQRLVRLARRPTTSPRQATPKVRPSPASVNVVNRRPDLPRRSRPPTSPHGFRGRQAAGQPAGRHRLRSFPRLLPDAPRG